MEQVYLSLKKVDYMNDLQQSVNSYAIDGKVSFPIDGLNLVNGRYHMTLVGTSANGSAQKWDLGPIDVWFKEGQQKTTNNHIPESYLMKANLEASFPNPDFQGRLWLTCAVSGVILLSFVKYLTNQLTLVTPFEKLNVSGSLLMLSLVSLMLLLAAFWIGYVNLLQLLWIVALSSPVSIILIYKGLQTAKIR